jgi:hypothetical protein
MNPGYLNDDELPEGLSSLKKENPFKVPDDYFGSLADHVMQKISKIPDVEKMCRENVFNVPDGYFDSLPSSIQQQIADEKKKNIFEEWIAIVLQPKYSLALATFIILAIFGIKYFTKPVVVESPDNMLSYADVRNSGFITELDESTLVDMLEQENNNESLKEDNSMEQYLLDNDIDISQLENRL